LFVVVSLLVSAVIAAKTPPNPYAAARCGTIAFTLTEGCPSVSTHKAYSECNQTTKTCYCLPTFSGNASLSNPCDCAEPNTVFLSASQSINLPGPDAITYGQPYCIDLPTLEATKAAQVRDQKHISYVIEFFNNTIGTTPTEILATMGIPRLQRILSPNVRSRISPAGEFDGFEGVVEYFYGFVANPALRVTNVDYRTVSASGNVVSAKANVWLHNTQAALTGGHPPEFWNLTTFAFFTFDENDLISSIDVSVPNLGAILDIPDSQPGAAQIKQGIIFNTCLIMTQASPGFPAPNGTCYPTGVWVGDTAQQRTQNCVAFMNSIPFGTRERHQASNFVCRGLHAALTYFRPNPHCFHAGPTGGGACVDTDYSNYYLKDY